MRARCSRLRRRGERGAVAVMVGFLAVVLFAMAALTVDLGNAWTRKRTVQKQADVSALGAGDLLPMTTSNKSAILTSVASYLNKPENKASGQPTAVASQLDDGSDANGEVIFEKDDGSSCVTNCNRMKVIAPTARVDFSFAGVVGSSHVGVSRSATVQVMSPAIKSLPFYAFTGCDYGLQTIAQPTNGHSADIVMLSHDGESTVDPLTGVTTDPASDPVAPTVPLHVAPPNDIVTITSSVNGLTGVSQVGFFLSGTTSAGPEPETVDSASFISSSASAIKVHLPTAVANTQALWYVRVKFSATNKWSIVKHGSNPEILDAIPLQVGSPTLMCGQGSSAGNFGTLKLTNRSASAPTGQSENIAYNVASGLQFSLGMYPSPHSDWLCPSSDSAAVFWPSSSGVTPAGPVNCVPTKPGLDLDAAQMGFLDGADGQNKLSTVDGRLTNVGPQTGCAADGTPATTSSLSGYGLSRPINNDNLACFLTDSTVNVGDISASTYTLGHPVLSQAIYNSPRFAIVPVLGVQPSNGSSDDYQIIDIRPAFITDQPMTATKLNQQVSSTNGISLSSTGQHDIESMQVIFFNKAALPDMPGGGDITTYSGSGPKILRLVG